MDEWWNKGTSIPFNSMNFHKIIDFFLFNCPSEIEKGNKKQGTKTYEKVSQRATTLRAQGWKGGFLNTLLASMKRTTSGHLEYRVFNASRDICCEVNMIEKSVTLTDLNFEMIVISERTDMNKTSTIFYYIRNAFAHGSFSVITDNGRTIYYLESAKNSTIKARLRLREETLMKWIKDFSLSPKELKLALSQDRKQQTKKKKKKKGSVAA